MLVVVVLAGAGAAVAVVTTSGSGGGGGTPSASEVFLAPAGRSGANPFMAPASGTNPSADAIRLLAAANLHPPTGALTAAAGGAGTSSTTPGLQGGVTVSGGTVGLYGGTMRLSTCDPSQMTSYLAANPDKAAAWASVEGISVSDIPGYISRLTSVVLRVDTSVTNHGFINGRATTIPEVLQAGTAVLVDTYGIPRARCFCGNPLTPPTALSAAPTYSGTQWPGFSPVTVAVVVAAPAPIGPNITVVDVNSGKPFLRPVGSSGSQDRPAPAGITSAFLSPVAAAPSTPATLSGNWVDPQHPTDPPWQLHTTPDGQNLTAVWHGGPGHTSLVGNFTGALNSAGTAYTGTFTVTEGTTTVTGTMTFTITSPQNLAVSYQASGVTSTLTLVPQSSAAGASTTTTSTPSSTTTGAVASPGAPPPSPATTVTTHPAPAPTTTQPSFNGPCVPSTITVNGHSVSGSGNGSSSSFSYKADSNSVTIGVSGLGPDPPCTHHFLLTMSGSDPQGGHESGSNCQPAPGFTSGPWGVNQGDQLQITLAESNSC